MTRDSMTDTDLIRRHLLSIADASRREDGSDIPLGEQLREAASVLERQAAEIERLRDRDTCMCGSPMAAHDIGSGHSPVSMYDYNFTQAIDRAEAAEAQLARAREALADIGVYGCGMLSQPAEMNCPEVAWLRKRIDAYERAARALLSELEAGE